MLNNIQKLALGTAQFGLRYGENNQSGIVEEKEVEEILQLAKKYNILTIDTAIAYGKSESVLGQKGVRDFSVVTKLPEVLLEGVNVYDWINRQILKSLRRLNLEVLDGILLHRPNQLLGDYGDQIFQSLIKIKNKGIIKKIGISIYNPDEIDLILKRYPIDIIQAPMSIIDRRLINSGWLSEINHRGISLHVRSVFLQGLLLLRKNELDKKFYAWSDFWELWDAWLEETGQSRLSACLKFALSKPEVDRVIVGIDSTLQFKEILEATKLEYFEPPKELQCNDETLLNPFFWSKL